MQLSAPLACYCTYHPASSNPKPALSSTRAVLVLHSRSSGHGWRLCVCVSGHSWPVRLRARGLPMRARLPLAGVKITVKTRRATARRRPPTLLASVSRILPPPPPPPTGRCFVFPPFKPLPTYSPLLHPPPSSLPEDCCPGKELPLALAVPSSHLASSHGRDKSLGVFLIAIKVGSWVLLDWKSARVPAHPCPV